MLLLHGFPDSSALWRRVTPRLIESGHRVIAPDQRGFGRSEAPDSLESYRLDAIASDAIGLLDELRLEKVHLVGHDWGAVVGWLLAGAYPERIRSYVALSVGHPKAYARAGWEQKLRAWYVLFFQLRGVAEKTLAAGDWRWLRKATRHHPEAERWIADLSRPGRLTAALSWYRANFERLFRADVPRARAPVLGIWSTGDVALTEAQMKGSERYAEAGFCYERFDDVGHWIPLDAPDRLAEVLVEEFRNPPRHAD